MTDVAPDADDSNAAANTVAEGAANGSTVGITASSTDVNGPAVTYSLVGDTSGGGFTINATTGVVTVADSTKIDFETPAGHAYTITVQASDGTLTSSQAFAIAVTDVAPSTPIDSDAATNTIAEGAANGSTVGVTASSTDVNGPAVTYSLIGDTSGGGFTINAATGWSPSPIPSKIDFEIRPGYDIPSPHSQRRHAASSQQAFVIAVVRRGAVDAAGHNGLYGKSGRDRDRSGDDSDTIWTSPISSHRRCRYGQGVNGEDAARLSPPGRRSSARSMPPPARSP